jgi:hypothetical protein
MLRWGPWVIYAFYAFTAVLGRPAFAQTNPSVAFFYGKPVPVGQLGRFDWVVVEPDHLDARGLDELQRAGVQVFAYLSLGEAAPEAIDPGWILGRNAPRGSVIVDPRAADSPGSRTVIARASCRGSATMTCPRCSATVAGSRARSTRGRGW